MFPLPSGRPALMGILNVTPDSFSDGGRYVGRAAAVDRARSMIDEGADLIDIGGESTRPGAADILESEELERTVPVLRDLSRLGIPTSIDTRKAAVARAAMAEGARVVNDVSGFRDPAMIEACANSDCSICIMHMPGDPQTMQGLARYDNVVEEVWQYLLRQATVCETAGIERERIWLDPGIGFGKTTDHNLHLLRRLPELVGEGYPVLIGVSRKAFIGRILASGDDPLPTEERLEGTLAAQVAAQLAGARIIRAHDVRAARRAIEVAAAISGA